jgi:hypothetical protein
MSMTPRAGRWLNMAEDARSMAERTHDHDGKLVMLDIANSYEELAAWAAKTDEAHSRSREAGAAGDCGLTAPAPPP